MAPLIAWNFSFFEASSGQFTVATSSATQEGLEWIALYTFAAEPNANVKTDLKF
jgi:hypothetical protein